MKNIKFTELICLIAVVAGIAITVIGIFMPPAGIISESILIALGELLIFGAGLLGVDLHLLGKIKNKD